MEAVVWEVRPSSITDLTAAWSLLNGEERARADGMAPRPRERFIRRRAALRQLLGAHRHQPASAVPLVTGWRGRPICEGGPHCSVSAADDVAVIALADAPIGIDIELARDVPEAADIAAEWFPEEVAARIAAAPTADAIRAFLRAWVRLEALAKATGVGLADRLQHHPVAVADRVQVREIDGDWYVHEPALPGIPYCAVVAPTADLAVTFAGVLPPA